MRCVVEIKVIDVDYDMVRIAHHPQSDFAEIVDSNPPEYTKVKQEVIEGRRFVNIRGQEFCVGMSKQVQEAIGLPFEVYQTQREEIVQLRDSLSIESSQQKTILKQLIAYQRMSFWARVKFLFRGWK